MATSVQPVPAAKSDVQAEADFIAKFSADDAPAAPAKPAASPSTPASGASATTEDQPGEKPAAAVDATEHDDDETEEHDEEEGEGEEAGETVDGETDKPSAGDKADDTDVEETEESKAEAEATAHATEVRELLEAAGLKVSLKDLPAEARPLVQKKLDHAHAAITRVLQEQTRFRAERASFVAEQQFRDAHPEMAITEILAKNPDLIAKVQEHLDTIEDPAKKRLFEIDLADARKKALDTVTQQAQSAERINQRADEIESYTKRACEKLGIPEAVVEQAIALALLDKPEEQRDLTEQELDQVITKQARLLKGLTRKTALADRKAVIQERTRDKQTSTPAVRSGNGTAPPAPAGKKLPKNDDEFIAQFVAKI